MDRTEVVAWLSSIKDKYIHGGDEFYDHQRKVAIDYAINYITSRRISEWEKFRRQNSLAIPCIVQEECGELIQAVSKVCRAMLNAEEQPMDKLLEEIADVFIAINLLCDTWSISDDEVVYWINRKMERNIKRMEENNNENK